MVDLVQQFQSDCQRNIFDITLRIFTLLLNVCRSQRPKRQLQSYIFWNDWSYILMFLVGMEYVDIAFSLRSIFIVICALY